MGLDGACFCGARKSCEIYHVRKNPYLSYLLFTVPCYSITSYPVSQALASRHHHLLAYLKMLYLSLEVLQAFYDFFVSLMATLVDL